LRSTPRLLLNCSNSKGFDMVVANQGCCQKHGGGAEESHGDGRNIKRRNGADEVLGTCVRQVSTPVKLVVMETLVHRACGLFLLMTSRHRSFAKVPGIPHLLPIKTQEHSLSHASYRGHKRRGLLVLLKTEGQCLVVTETPVRLRTASKGKRGRRERSVRTRPAWRGRTSATFSTY
jgi:hypothetical protein